MNGADERERKEKVLEAIVIEAMLRLEEGCPDFSKPAPPLPQVVLQDLQALGGDLVERIVLGRVPASIPDAVEVSCVQDQVPPYEVIAALNRNRGEDDLSQKAREEMERKVHDLVMKKRASQTGSK